MFPELMLREGLCFVKEKGGGRGHFHIVHHPDPVMTRSYDAKTSRGSLPPRYFARALTASRSSIGMTTTVNGVPASSLTCGSGLPNSLPPTIEFS